MKSFIQRISFKQLIFFIFFISAILILFNLPRIGGPIFISLVLTMIMRPIMSPLGKMGLGKNLSVIIILLGMGFFLVYPIVKFIPVIASEAENLQVYVPKVEKYVREKYFELNYKLKVIAGYEIKRGYIDDGILLARSMIKDIILSTPNLVASLLELLILVPFFIFFFLRDGKKMISMALNFVPNNFFEKGYYLFHQSNKKIGDYIFAKFVEASIIGIIITVGLLIMDVRFAFILGLIAAVTNVVPYVGPLIGAIPGILIALIEYNTGPTFWGITILYLVANIVDLAFVFPILVSKIVNLHPIIVVVSVILGSQYFGVVGMIVSIPFAASLKLFIGEVFRGLDVGNIQDL